MPKKLFMDAIDRPHLLIFSNEFKLKSGKTIEGIQSSESDLPKLQYSLAYNWGEEELRKFIRFFEEALQRSVKMDLGRDKKAEIINFDDWKQRIGRIPNLTE